jgi:hypothetical protein
MKKIDKVKLCWLFMFLSKGWSRFGSFMHEVMRYMLNSCLRSFMCQNKDPILVTGRILTHLQTVRMTNMQCRATELLELLRYRSVKKYRHLYSDVSNVVSLLY